jgi:MFS family permease
MSQSIVIESPSSPAVGNSHPAVRKRSNERTLDALAFFLADVADGLGPFLIIDLTTRRGWSSAQAGMAMAMLLLGTVATQSFAGAWIDRTRQKRLAISVAALVVAAASLGLYYSESHPAVFALQAITGVAVTIFAPGLAAISLGLVGREQLPRRAGRNEACFHAGNVAAAGLAIGANWMFGSPGVFYVVAMTAALSAICAQMICEADIDHERARGADGHDLKHHVLPIRALMRNHQLIWFGLSVVLFHFANAAMLPLVGQKLGSRSAEFAPTLMAVCIVIAQIAMVPVALLASRRAAVSRRNVFLIGFAVLPIRGALYTFTDSPSLLIANQLLDGVGAGIFGVVSVLAIADLTRGTGRFNLAQGMIATATGIGAAASNYLTGLIVDASSHDAGFYFLASIAVIALGVFSLTFRDSSGGNSFNNS